MHVGMYTPYVCVYVDSIITSNLDVLLVLFAGYVSVSVLPATVLSGDWKA
jgi:hypothetical protein